MDVQRPLFHPSAPVSGASNIDTRMLMDTKKRCTHLTRSPVDNTGGQPRPNVCGTVREDRPTIQQRRRPPSKYSLAPFAALPTPGTHCSRACYPTSTCLVPMPAVSSQPPPHANLAAATCEVRVRAKDSVRSQAGFCRYAAAIA